MSIPHKTAASRSTSPSSRAYSAYSAYSAYRQTGTIPKKKSGIPRSLAGSRETSPTRPHPAGGTLKRTPGSAGGAGFSTSSPRRGVDRPPINPTGRPVLAQKMLQQSREAECALADALSPDDFDISVDMSRLGLQRKARDESDESEASSVCSERSFDSSFRRNDVRTPISATAPHTYMQMLISCVFPFAVRLVERLAQQAGQLPGAARGHWQHHSVLRVHALGGAQGRPHRSDALPGRGQQADRAAAAEDPRAVPQDVH